MTHSEKLGDGKDFATLTSVSEDVIMSVVKHLATGFSSSFTGRGDARLNWSHCIRAYCSAQNTAGEEAESMTKTTNVSLSVRGSTVVLLSGALLA